MARRSILSPQLATNEGSRRLRELLRKMSFGALAKRLLCDESSVRAWAREHGKPSLIMRARLLERAGIPEDAWDEAPSSDVYAGADPATRRTSSEAPPTTRQR